MNRCENEENMVFSWEEKNLHEDLAWSWALIWTPPLKYVWIMKILKAFYFCEDTARDFGQVWCYIEVKYYLHSVSKVGRVDKILFVLG